MVSKEFHCSSRESKDWLLAAFGDKGQTLQHHIDVIVDYCKAEQIPIEFFLKPRAKIFTVQMAKQVRALIQKESCNLDSELRISHRCKKQDASQQATGIVKDLVLLCLTNTSFVKETGEWMTRTAYCAMLSIRRPQKARFLRERDVYEFKDEIGDSTKDSLQTIIEAYGRIKKCISEL